MSHLSNALLQNERIQYQTRPHDIVLALPTGLLCFYLLVMYPLWHTLSKSLCLSFHLKTLPPLISAPLLIAFGLILARLLLSLAKACILRFTTEYGVTNIRIVQSSGLISRNTCEMTLKQLEAVEMQQTILGRLLDYGTIKVLGTGQALDPMPFLKGPVDFKRAIYTEHTTSTQ